MKSWLTDRKCVAVPLAFCGMLLYGCAAGGLTAEEKAELGDQDPFENVNRITYGFNETVDSALLEPSARAYAEVTPQPAQTCVGNISDNLKEPVRSVGHAIAGHGERAVNSWIRVFFNTVVGGFGCLEVADKGLGLPRHDTDIGLGVRAQVDPSESVYIVLPLLGPSSAIDSVGEGVGAAYLDPLTTKSWKNPYETTSAGSLNTIRGILILNKRAELLQTTDLIDEAALDPYIFVREAYLERRAILSEEIRETKY